MSLTCGICGTKVEPAPGAAIAATDICPGCSLRVRHRAVHAWMAATGVDPTRAGTTLACNCLPAEQKFLFPSIHRLVNFDIRPLPYVDAVMDIHDMGRIEDASVDTFIALHVFNHVEDDGRALAEVARVLKPGGIAVLTIPFREGSPTTADADPLETYGSESRERYGVADYRTYGRGDFRDLLLAHGFGVEEFGFRDPLVARPETVFIGRKRA